MPGKLRRNIDLRVVSYAISVLAESKGNAELAVASQFLAANSLQLAGSLRALIEVCKATAASEAVVRSMEPDQARRTQVMFEALADIVEQQRSGHLAELIELMVVFAKESLDDKDAEHRLVTWAHGLGIDTSPLLIDEEEARIDFVRERRTSENSPRQLPPVNRKDDRYVHILRLAVKNGISSMRVKMSRGRVEVMGTHPTDGEVHLRWVKISMQEAEVLIEAINREISLMSKTAPPRNVA
jgi:hypothetical protein